MGSKKVKKTFGAIRSLLDYLSSSSELHQALKSANKHKKIGRVYARFAARLNETHHVVPFTGPKIAAKIKSLCSAWRSVDAEVAKLWNWGAATDDVENKKGSVCIRLYAACLCVIRT